MNDLIFIGGKRLTVGTMFCVGSNYSKHAAEMGGGVPEEPVIFIKPPAAYLPHGGTIKPPSFSKMVHHEVELVVVIGKHCSGIKPADAVEYIAGYAVGIDVTLRDIQNKAKKEGKPWAVAKGFVTSAPISPVVPAENFGNVPPDFNLLLNVNGVLRQKSSTSLMERNVGTLVEYISNVFTLSPGDCIFTGTPEGVGEISKGDILYAELEGHTSIEVTVG